MFVHKPSSGDNCMISLFCKLSVVRCFKFFKRLMFMCWILLPSANKVSRFFISKTESGISTNLN
jgi:hypothetical protein